MAKRALKTSPLQELDEAELQRLARVVGRQFAGRPRLMTGNRPHRLKPGSGVEFLDHREYRPGDDLRNVDWLATARSNRVQIRRFRDETSADWVICLDCSASMGTGGGQKWHLAAQLAAAYAYLLIRLDNRVATILFRGKVIDLKPPGRGQHAYAGLLRLLEKVEPDRVGGGSSLGACIPHISRGCQVIVISDFLVENGMATDLAQLSVVAEAVHAIQILSRDETRIEGSGRLLLEDVETGDQASLEISPKQLEQAKQELREFQQRLIRNCRKHHVAFSFCEAEDGWRKALMRQMQQLGNSNA